jgi:hypothetical protein
MIAVTVDHILNVLETVMLKAVIPCKLPAGYGIHYHNSQFVACSQECGGLRVMRSAYKIETRFFDLPCIPVLRIIRHCISYIRIILVPVGTPDLYFLTV